MRDETSNPVWAVERSYEGPLGGPIDRILAWKTRRAAGAPKKGGKGGKRWPYQVAPATPPYLVPFIPERHANAQIGLRRGRMHQGLNELGEEVTSGAKGEILNPKPFGSPLRIFEEEVPRSGAHVTRAWQLARAREGKIWLWLGQRERPGRPVKEPGAVVFDRLRKV